MGNFFIFSIRKRLDPNQMEIIRSLLNLITNREYCSVVYTQQQYSGIKVMVYSVNLVPTDDVGLYFPDLCYEVRRGNPPRLVQCVREG